MLAFARSALGLPPSATAGGAEGKAAAEYTVETETQPAALHSDADAAYAAAVDPRELLCARTVLACLRMLARVFVAALPVVLAAEAAKADGAGAGAAAARTWAPVAVVFDANLRALAGCGQPAVLEAAHAVRRELQAEAARCAGFEVWREIAGPAWDLAAL